jgi:hypothetical protein
LKGEVGIRQWRALKPRLSDLPSLEKPWRVTESFWWNNDKKKAQWVGWRELEARDTSLTLKTMRHWYQHGNAGRSRCGKSKFCVI